MFQLIKIKDPADRWKLLSQFEIKTSCFIVSDIKTKLSVETYLLDKHGFLPGHCVMRVNEFYKELFFSSCLDWNLISDAFVKKMFSEFCEKHSNILVQNLHKSKSIFKFFNLFLIILFHKEHSSLLEEWFEKKLITWKPWFKLCQEFFLILESKKIIHESGLKALLLHQLPNLNQITFYKKKIFIDLAYSFDLCEKEIFQEISRHKEICILAPELEEKFRSSEILDIYQKLEKEIVVKNIESFFKKRDITSQDRNPHGFKIEDCKKQLTTKFFTIKSQTQVEEVRKIIVQIYKLLKKGISLEEIVILAPNIEDYWFILKSYFERENIPFKKSISTKLIDFPNVKYWLSSMHLHLQDFSFFHLERFCFYKESKKNFSDFKSNYFYVPNREMAKHLLFKEKVRAAHETMTGREFIDWALSLWPKDSASSLLDLVLKVFQDFPMEENLKIKSWLQICESNLSVLEKEIKSENNYGVSCLSFNAFHSVKSPYIFIMGLDEESLNKRSSETLTETESQSLLDDLGFPIPFTHIKERESNLYWFLQSSLYKEIYLSFAYYNFSGDIRTPSIPYLLSNHLFKAKEIHIGENLLWDSNKKLGNLSEILKPTPIKKDQIQVLENSVHKELPNFFQKQEITLSPNRFKIYRDCPFKYAGQYLFFINEGESIEREISPMSKGSLVHTLFEEILKRYPNLNPTQEQILQLIQDMKPNDKKLIHDNQWYLIESYLKDILKVFLEKEKKDKLQIPSLKMKDVESEVVTYWNQEQGELSQTGHYVFKGTIDRIDEKTNNENSKEYIIRDYKGSLADYRHISKWIKEGGEELQLTFYAQALQKGLIKDLVAGPVSALFYSSYKENFSAKGYLEKNSDLDSLMEGASQHKKEKQDLNHAIVQSNKLAKKIVTLIEKGQFAPNPIKAKLCKSCSYNRMCRLKAL